MQLRVGIDPLGHPAELAQREDVTLEPVGIEQSHDSAHHALEAAEVEPVNDVKDLEALPRGHGRPG